MKQLDGVMSSGPFTAEISGVDCQGLFLILWRLVAFVSDLGLCSVRDVLKKWSVLDDKF